jgi:hypothetical protein
MNPVTLAPRRTNQLQVLMGFELVPEIFHTHKTKDVLKRISQRKRLYGLEENVKITDDHTLPARTCEIRIGDRVLAQKTLEAGEASDGLIELLDMALAKI